MPPFDVAGFSRSGRHSLNQDAMLLTTEVNGVTLLGVADGLGGRASGDIAANIAINVADHYLYSNPSNWSAERLFENICVELARSEAAAPEQEGMSTTLTICSVVEYNVRFAHIGDSRLYHLRGNGISTISSDQTEVQALIDQGILRAADAKSYPRRNVLLSALSAKRKYEPIHGVFEIEAGDRLVLTSDGIHGIISKKQIRDLSLATSSAVEFADKLRVVAETIGVADDYTAVCGFTTKG